MRMTIARALKERKRIIGEMNTIWNRINNNNTVTITIREKQDGSFNIPSDEEINARRKLCPTKLMDTWLELRDKLMSIKAALHVANTGIINKLIKLAEAKTELQLVEDIQGYSNELVDYGESTKRLINVVFDQTWKLQRSDVLRKEINDLQDEIDEYNATHYIEVAD